MSFIKLFTLLMFSLISTRAFSGTRELVTYIYIMLDMDDTLVTRIELDNKTQQQLIKRGYKPQRLEFTYPYEGNQKIYKWYRSMMHDQALRDEQKIKVTKNEDKSLLVEEVVVLRPTIKEFLEKLDKLNSFNVCIRFFIASRNDDIRNQNIINKLNIEINGKKLKDKVKLISRDDFRVFVHSPEKGWIPGKSLALLREKYRESGNEVKPNQYIVNGDKMRHGTHIIFIDDLQLERFVIGGLDFDRIFQVTKFSVDDLNDKNVSQDKLYFDDVYDSIKPLIT